MCSEASEQATGSLLPPHQLPGLQQRVSLLEVKLRVLTSSVSEDRDSVGQDVADLQGKSSSARLAIEELAERVNVGEDVTDSMAKAVLQELTEIKEDVAHLEQLAFSRHAEAKEAEQRQAGEVEKIRQQVAELSSQFQQHSRQFFRGDDSAASTPASSAQVRQQHADLMKKFDSCWASTALVQAWIRDATKPSAPMNSTPAAAASNIAPAIHAVPSLPNIIPPKAAINQREYDAISLAPNDWPCKWLRQKCAMPPNTDPLDGARRSIVNFLRELMLACKDNVPLVRWCRESGAPGHRQLGEVLAIVEPMEKVNFLLARKHNLVTGKEDSQGTSLWDLPSSCWYFEQTKVCRWTRRFLAALQQHPSATETDAAIQAAAHMS
jgi:hypothetical protein